MSELHDKAHDISDFAPVAETSGAPEVFNMAMHLGIARGWDAAKADFPEADELARMFHKAYEEMAPYFGYKTREDSAVPWEDVPETNKLLMIATAQRVINALMEG